jgi:isoleucyl-tRNA synthetase
MFKPVDNKLDFPEMERRILEFWKETRAFERLREQNRGKKKWSFIDGPITANNPMGVHHAWGRTYKDIYQRYHAMLGYDQRYQNGFDCHGLWVEVEVEKAMGFNSKRDIVEYGLAEFVRACCERVMKYAALISEESARLGQWMDWDDSYYTMSDNNSVHIWHFLKKCHENGWLYRGTRSMPWCWRCGTSLSQLEQQDSYEEVTHTSVYARFPLTSPGHEGESLLVWTTTPWTLTANVAAAVHPGLDYARVRQGDQVLYLSRGTVGRLVGEYEDLGNVKGSELVDLTYTGPFDDLEAASKVQHRVIPWLEVGEEEGTGIVHIAPGCGAEDFELSRVNNLPVLIPLNEDGSYVPRYGQFSGRHVTEAAEIVFGALNEKGMLYRLEEYTHRYPVCWRCHTELVFRVATEWYISVEEARPRMVRAAREVKWIPDYAGKRMEDWLNNMSDWNISRKRFWGLVLPFYVCDCGEVTVAGSREELRALAVQPELVDALPELHRPWIDDIKIRCPKCGSEEVARIPEVGDAWLDAGIVPYSTLHYMDDPEYWRTWFPAEFVTESREQIRLWFYSMLFMSVTLENTTPYKEVLAYEKVYDEKGRPMHKSWGNAIWFKEAVDVMGADVMRWLFAGANVTQNVHFGYGISKEIKRNLLTLWNTYSFFVMYANLDGWMPAADDGRRTTDDNVRTENENNAPNDGMHKANNAPSSSVVRRPSSLSELDRWILARLHELTGQVRAELDSYDAASVTRQVDAFVDDLSNWYVRRSRRRFWKSESDSDKLAAYSTLYEVLLTLSKLIAPIMPFLAEEMYQNLANFNFEISNLKLPRSVHHCAFPEVDEAMVDRQLLKDTALIQKVVGLGRAGRNASGVKVRQPLRQMVVRAPSKEDEEALARLEPQVLEELNVKRMVVTSQVGDLITYVIKPNLPVLGPKYGKRMGAIRSWLASSDPAEIATQVEAGNTFTVADGEGGTIELLPEELLVETREREGFAVAQEGGLVVAFDTELDDELLAEGMARDLVRVVNDMRKSADFDVSDRITLRYALLRGEDSADARHLQDAVARHGDYIRAETLSSSLEAGDGEEGAYSQEEELGKATVRFSVERDR